MIIAVANLKGGLLRSTVTVMLAHTYRQTGKRVAIADTTSSGDSARFAALMNENCGAGFDAEVHLIPFDPYQSEQEVEKASVGVRAHIQEVEKALGDSGVVIIDTNPGVIQALNELDSIVDHVVVPYDYSPASLTSTLRTFSAFTAPTTVLPYRPYPDSAVDGREQMQQVAEKSTYVSEAILSYDEGHLLSENRGLALEYEKLADEILQNV